MLRTTGSLAACAALPSFSRAAPATSQPWLWDSDTKDRSSDHGYFDQHIKKISDADLFASLDLKAPALVKVCEAVDRNDYPAAYRAWGEHWATVAPSRGLFSDASVTLSPRKQAAESFESQRGEKLAAAQRIRDHNINGWGDVTIQHGPVVDFDADYGRNGKYGFHYWGWAWPLIVAYLLTNDQKYLAEFDALFNAWYEQRDEIHGGIPSLDVIWYELGLGNRSEPFIEYYCLPYEKRTPQTHERMLKTLLGAARWLFREESGAYRDGNWQIMGSFGMAMIGTILGEFKESSDWVKLGAQRLAEHVERDFFPDGCHSERVPSSYMLIAYRDPRNMARLLQDQPQYAQIAKKLSDPLERTLNWYMYALPPDGFIPAINDGARGRMPGGLFDDAAQMFGRNEILYVKSTLLEAKAQANLKAPAKCSEHFAPSGFTFMRSDWTPEARYMLINHGPSGGGHSHADSLSFQMHAFGQAMAIDSGIGYTYDDPNHGPWYKRTKAHNVLMVDDADLDRRAAEGKDVVWTSLKILDFFAATHHGYVKSKGVTHRRHIAFVKPDYFLIYDVAQSQSAETHALSWNLHAPLKIEPAACGFASAGSPGLLVIPSSLAWKQSQSTGPACVIGIRGFKKDYADIPWLRFENSLGPKTSATFAVLLHPFSSSRLKVDFREIGSTHIVVESAGGVDHLLFAASIENDVHFDGACAVLRYADKRLQSWAVSQSKTLVVAGRTLLDSNEPRDAEGSA